MWKGNKRVLERSVDRVTIFVLAALVAIQKGGGRAGISDVSKVMLQMRGLTDLSDFTLYVGYVEGVGGFFHDLALAGYQGGCLEINLNEKAYKFFKDKFLEALADPIQSFEASFLADSLGLDFEQFHLSRPKEKSMKR